jgi:hypothetical protein
MCGFPIDFIFLSKYTIIIPFDITSHLAQLWVFGSSHLLGTTSLMFLGGHFSSDRRNFTRFDYFSGLIKGHSRHTIDLVFLCSHDLLEGSGISLFLK